MRLTACVLALLILLVPPDPRLTARWDSSTSATIAWHQTARACLYREPRDGVQAFIGCYEGAGRVVVRLGHVGPLDAAYRPTVGDVYVLQQDGVVSRAPLRGVLLLPLARA